MNVNTFVAECKREVDQREKLLERNGDELNKTELLAKGLITTVERALEASSPKTPSNIALKPWWNDACKEQNAKMRSARTAHRKQPIDIEKRTECVKRKKAMRREIVKAKRFLMSKIVAGLKEPKDVFRAVKGANGTTDSRVSGPTPGHTHTKTHTGEEWHFHEPNPEANEWPPLTCEEIKTAVWRPANTAPGADCISNEAWKRAWEPLGNIITRLYNLCLESGNHPSIFKKADLIAIPKPGRPRDEP
ncbi:putative 115 kDa protein in type-1 retrotransposable element R1DM [Ceratocystis lukuohia]|uniref:115 kDa protein in type-1 retrotransposable element R1DM n=1 Tax=Ceratocystis lukuohia TaxID=2019550 RepID=A0ABR4MCM5_9PEZI